MVEVFCHGCGERGRLEKVGSPVRHACGSTDVDLWLDSPAQRRRLAALRGETPIFTDFMTREATTQQPMPPPVEEDGRWPGYVGGDDEPEPGWSEYAGPAPHANPMNPPRPSGEIPTGLTKRQPGTVPGETNLYVYDRHNPGLGYGEDPPPPAVARHDYPSTQTSTPFLGRRTRTSWPLDLPGSSCPRCACTTALMPDQKRHTHWMCQGHCGSLVDLDRHPTLDPYRPPADHPWGADPFRRGRLLFSGRKDGQLQPRIEKIALANPGLSVVEVLRLARHSVIQYPEA